MSKHHYPPLIVSSEVVDRTDRFLSVSRAERVEVVVYWSGRSRVNGVCVERVWLPAQYSSPYSFLVGPDALFELNRELYRLGHRVLAQVHTHPAGAFHSDADDENAISLEPGAISAVIPGFGSYSVADLKHTIFFERHGGGWKELTPLETARRVRFVR